MKTNNRLFTFFALLVGLLAIGFVVLLLVGLPILIGHLIWFVFNGLHWTEGLWSTGLKWCVGFLLMLLTGLFNIKIGNVEVTVCERGEK